MSQNDLKPTDLAGVTGVSRTLIYDVLSYRRRLSLNLIRKLSEKFRVSQVIFSQPYKLKKT